MKSFAVYVPGGHPRGSLAAADDVAFVKEGIAWPALFVPVLWLAFHRMWIVLIAFIAVAAGFEYVTEAGLVPEAFTGVASVAIAVLFALLANSLREWSLGRKGYRFAGAVAAPNRTEAELRFFRVWLSGNEFAPATPGPAVARRKRPRTGDDGVIGALSGA